MSEDQPALVAAWQQGEERAVRAIFDTYYPRAVRIALLSGLPEETAQDCAQEAFVHAFQRRHQLRDVQAFPLWFHRIITNHIIDQLRRQQRNKEQPLDLSEDMSEDWGRHHLPQPDEHAILSEERDHLRNEIQRLPVKYRVPLVLHYYGDFSFREIAAIIGKREGNVRVIIHRALQRLRTLAQEQTPHAQGHLLQPVTVSHQGGF
jgi:RNA polymerase sigma-70 factor (ECF subfamily)